MNGSSLKSYSFKKCVFACISNCCSDLNILFDIYIGMRLLPKLYNLTIFVSSLTAVRVWCMICLYLYLSCAILCGISENFLSNILINHLYWLVDLK